VIFAKLVVQPLRGDPRFQELVAAPVPKDAKRW